MCVSIVPRPLTAWTLGAAFRLSQGSFGSIGWWGWVIILLPREKCIDSVPNSRPSAGRGLQEPSLYLLLPILDASQSDEDRFSDAKSNIHRYLNSNYETGMMLRTPYSVLTPRQSCNVDTIVLIVKKLKK